MRDQFKVDLRGLTLQITQFSMGKVSVNNVKQGMTLNSDVVDITGRLLLGRGTVIDEKHITIFKIWGIVEVDIQGLEEDRTGTYNDLQADIATIRNAEKDLLQIFHHTDLHSPVIDELFRIALRNKVRIMTEGGSRVRGS
jgi:hypothetical protein